MADIEMTAFQIIANVGAARSKYLEAVEAAKRGSFSKAEDLLAEGDEDYAKGHDAHLLLMDCTDTGTPLNEQLLLMHAEDQLMSAEGFKLLAKEFIEVYSTIEKISAK